MKTEVNMFSVSWTTDVIKPEQIHDVNQLKHDQSMLCCDGGASEHKENGAGHKKRANRRICYSAEAPKANEPIDGVPVWWVHLALSECVPPL